MLDAGVLIAVMGRSDVRDTAARIAIAAAVREDEVVFPASTCAEILVLRSRLGGEATPHRDDLIDTLPARIESVSRQIAAAAAGFRAQRSWRLKLADALVIATPQVVTADRILATDRGWSDIGMAVPLVAGKS